jgi:hypothetical protein
MGAPFAAALAAFFTSTATYVVVIRTILVNVALAYLQRALMQESRKNLPPINITIRDPVENRRVVIGRCRVGGAFAFYSQSNKVAYSSDGAYLHYVVILAGHQVNAIRDIWLDKVQIPEASIDAGTGEVTTGSFAGKCYIWKHLGGATQSADAQLDAVFPQWTSNHLLKGCAYVHIRMERDDEIFPQGAPSDITAIVEGALLYDPRLDSTNGGSGSHRKDDPSTWEFSRNSALAMRWWLTGGSVVNDQSSRLVRYGFQAPDIKIDDTYVIAAANICDQTVTGAATTPDGDQVRYTCDCEFSTGETRDEIREAIANSMSGQTPYVHGKWRIYAGAYDSPLYAFTQDDLFTVEEAPIECEDTNGQEDRYNAVAGVFRDAANSYLEQSTPWRTNSTFETQDGSQRIPREIDLRFCTDRYRAQRLCELELQRSRMMRVIKIRGGLNLLQVAQHETFTLSHTTFGWTNRVFRCIERQLEFMEEAGRVVLTCRTEDSAIYADMATAAYLTPNTVSTVISVEAPDEPTSLATVPQLDAILVQWTRSPTPGVYYEVEASTSSTMSSPSTVYDGSDNQAFLDRTATTVYYFRVRAKRSGQYSAWVPSTGGISGAARGVTVTLIASASPGSASSVSTSASQTTGSVVVSATGGTPAYTYAWTWLSGGSGITITSPSAASTTFSAATLGDAETRTCIARCTISDSALASVTVDVAVTIERTSSFTATAAGTSPLYKQANNSTITSNNITATPSGGTPAYTYAWSIVTHDDPNSTPTINNSTSATCTVTTNQAPSSQTAVHVTVQCVVTDSIARTATTNTISITHYHDNGV